MQSLRCYDPMVNEAHRVCCNATSACSTMSCSMSKESQLKLYQHAMVSLDTSLELCPPAVIYVRCGNPLIHALR